MKDKFYIFLDIDGVLYDWNFIIKNGDKKSGTIKNFNPKSIEALNFLIEKLQYTYNVEIVITSTWRINMQKTIEILLNNGLNKTIKINSTEISNYPQNRELEILNYLQNNSCKNFVIIDDEMFDFDKYFNKNHIIKTNIFNLSLNKEMVLKYLKNLDNIENQVY